MNRSVLQQPKHGAQVNKNWFDMSHHVIFSDSIGLLSPVMAMETIPGESYKIDIESFCRSQAVNTSSFMRIKENYDVFFVPFRLLYSYCDQFFSQVSNYNSSLLHEEIQGRVPQQLPLISSEAFETDGAIWTATALTDEFGIKLQFGMSRIFNQLDYGIWQDGESDQRPQSFLNDRFSRNPFRAAAYQKIYHDYFQNTDYEVEDVNSFNLDWVAGGLVQANDDRLKELFRLRYRDLRRDGLTIAKPSFNASTSSPYLGDFNTNVFFGNSQVTTRENNAIPNSIRSMYGIDRPVWLQSQQGTPTTSSSSSPYAQGSQVFGTDFNVSSGYAMSAQNIRALLAFDKLTQNVGLGGRDYVSQIESRFGIKLPQLRSNRSTLLGSFDGNVVISEVVATNGEDLGQIGGKGTSSTGGDTINFECLEHGVIMVIHSFVPYTDYYSEMLDRNNTKSYFLDYYQPELDNLGAQPLYGYELSVLDQESRQLGIQGFVPRYIENKTRLNKVYGSQFSNAIWTGIRRPSSPAIAGYKALKINPKTFDSQFGIAFDGKTANDQFICRVQFNIHKLSPMSVYGLPNYQ